MFNRGLRSNLFFYRDSTGNEVDLVQDCPEGPRLLGIKSSHTLHPDFARGFGAFMRATGLADPPRFIVYQSDPEPAAYGAHAVHCTELATVLV